MNAVKKKAVVVTFGLLCFMMISYRYTGRDLSQTVEVSKKRPPSPKLTKVPPMQPSLPSKEPVQEPKEPAKQEAEIYKPVMNVTKTSVPKSQTTKPPPQAKFGRVKETTPVMPTVRNFNKDYTKECDHFIDWPTPFSKSGCPNSYKLTDNTLAIVIYVMDDIESLLTQTLLSCVQFIREANVTIRNIVFVYKNDLSYQTTIERQIEYFMELTSGAIPMIVKQANTEWKAKLEGVRLANSNQVLLLDDTYIVNRGFIRPLLSTIERNPHQLVMPHIDSLLPVRIYTQYSDKQTHPDSQIWQEGAVSTYEVIANMSMKRVAKKKIQAQPVLVRSSGVNGEVMAGQRDWLITLLSKMQTDEVAELSVLSYMCGDGVVVNKCSAVVRSSNYDLLAPVTQDPELLQRLYPFHGKQPTKQSSNGCKHISHYFDEVNRMTAKRG